MSSATPVTSPTPSDPQYPLPPSLLDAATYTDPDRYEREIETIFLRSWFPVCPSSDVASRGDFVVWDQLRQSIVISRLPDGSLAGWHNVCQHRGARLVEASGHSPTGTFRCPWHGFGYDLQGRVTTVPLRDTFDQGELAGLRTPQVQVSEWSGWVWLTLSPDTEALRPALGVMWDELGGYGLDGFTTRFRSSVHLKANWKIVMDAFTETWHVPFTHKDTLSGMVMWRDAALRITPPHSWMTIPIKGFTEENSGQDHRKSHLCHYLVFPNTIFSCFPTHLQMWSAWPLSPEETLLQAYEITGPTPPGMTDERWEHQIDRAWTHFLAVLEEDCGVINNISTVIHSQGFRRNMFNTAEGRLTAFHTEVARRLGER
jgi:phenylpropionate dioxygenase-like ring-hydroxylating dioxygenase large terminal subunit